MKLLAGRPDSALRPQHTDKFSNRKHEFVLKKWCFTIEMNGDWSILSVRGAKLVLSGEKIARVLWALDLSQVARCPFSPQFIHTCDKTSLQGQVWIA
ncbi:hypothetical protein AVEN_209419-1 [Araneus ventricosus]|uniref:Uncharacterized protein n=1 Tax=Araneus ventricosus TaxID=182803 RepID=A0A4Y2J7Y8_ARAVE|nr:hypothetical protein AVEN_209419-1 [Araneus ventricosus]